MNRREKIVLRTVSTNIIIALLVGLWGCLLGAIIALAWR